MIELSIFEISCFVSERCLTGGPAKYVLSEFSKRSIIELNNKEKVSTDIIKYVNRLSDFLFVAARFENKKDGDILWIPNKN